MSDENISDYRYPRATRKNNPAAGLAPEGRVKEAPKVVFDYNPHLPPALRFDPTGNSDALPELLEKARTSQLTEEDIQALAAALRRHEPWLEWAGKQEAQTAEVDPVALHTHERVSAQAILRIAARQDVTRSLFADPEQEYREAVQFYQHDVKWANRLILGDSLQVMASLARREDLAGKVQCIYMDPPYGIKYASNFQSEVGKRDVKDKPEDLTREPEMVKAYRDTWTLGVHSYLTYLRDRLSAAKELLTDSGSIFVQISDDNLHRARLIMDEVFGANNFVAHIAFKKTVGLGSSGLTGTLDYLLWYARDAAQLKFRQLYSEREMGEGTGYTLIETPNGFFRRMTRQETDDQEMVAQDAEAFCASPLLSSGYTPSCTYSFQFNGELIPAAKYSWKTNESGLRRLIASNRIIRPGTLPNYKQFASDYPVQPLSNFWSDVRASDPIYVVQTSTKVIQRCLLMTTDPGDLVLDPTCGSGTTAYVAEQWGRRWITMDTSRVALAIARQRLSYGQIRLLHA